jgi:hypothetical protein
VIDTPGSENKTRPIMKPMMEYKSNPTGRDMTTLHLCRKMLAIRGEEKRKRKNAWIASRALCPGVLWDGSAVGAIGLVIATDRSAHP